MPCSITPFFLQQPLLTCSAFIFGIYCYTLIRSVPHVHVVRLLAANGLFAGISATFRLYGGVAINIGYQPIR